MNAGLHDALSPAAEFDHSLFDAKFSPPRPRPGTVSRSDLIETARSSSCRLVAVTTPAGYGKSTFLAEWAATEDRPVAWVSLDRFDDDPATLLASLASAYCRAGLASPELVFDLPGQGMPGPGRAAPRLAAEFRASPVPFVLILDDLHKLRSPASHDVLALVISAIPRGSQLAAASRCEQPHLPRLRAAEDALEFGAGDLALDAAGARQIFTHAHVSVTPELAAAAAERTEGWPAGLYLAALIAKDADSQARNVTGFDRYVADYLYREALAGQPKAVQRFLRRTAVLDQLCGPLCEAVLGSAAAGIQLRRIEAESLFVTPLDRQRQWYRYHALYREFLLGELQRTEPGIIMTLRRRAADWYESNGFPALALEQLRKIDDIVTHRPGLGTFVDEVDEFRRAVTSSAASGAIGPLPLTPAELRLLPYLQTHLTADMIARRLFISSHTVKTEVKAIYRKLGVSSRNDAVQKATAIGLLGG